MSLSEGTILKKRYKIIKEIGKGAMGRVYLAMDKKTLTRVVIKELIYSSLSGLEDKNARKLFQQEAKIMKQLSHPGLPLFYGDFNKGRKYYIFMEYIEGTTLEEMVNTSKINYKNAIRLAISLADILHYLHTGLENPVVYRDLKPSNIIIQKDGNIKLIDFGISRYYDHNKDTDTFRLGSPGYAAPEQFKGRGQSTPQSDLFSLGVILYQMLTGYDPTESPFHFLPVRDVNPSVSAEAEEIIRKAVKIEPEDRYDNIKEFKDRLESLIKSPSEITQKSEERGHISKCPDRALSLFNNIREYYKKLSKHITLNIYYPFIASKSGLFYLRNPEYISEVDRLLRKYPEFINFKNKAGETPLHLAVKLDKKHIAEFLLLSGSHVNIEDKKGNTPLYYALNEQNKEIANLLISAEADINIKDKNENTLLHRMLLKHKSYMARFLINKGCEINVKNRLAMTPLHIAALSGNKKIAELLLDNGALIDIRDREGNSPVNLAFLNNKMEVAKILIKKGAEPDLPPNLM